MLIIDDSTSNDVLFPPQYGRGGTPRDYAVQPVEMFSPPSEMPLIPRSEWSARIKEKTAFGAHLSDIRNRAMNGQRMPSLDQGQVGYCWAHSVTHTVMLSRAIANQAYIPLSAYAVASIIKGGRDEGGWCGLAAQFARETGIPSQALWPQGSRSLSYDTPAMRGDAAKHRVTEDWVDLTRPVWNNQLTFDQLATCLIVGVPCAVDYNWWGHSVCAMDLVEVEPGSFGVRILNSWSDAWEDNGTAVIRGNRAVPDGAIATRSTTAG
jgi:hypothetical protein